MTARYANDKLNTNHVERAGTHSVPLFSISVERRIPYDGRKVEP